MKAIKTRAASEPVLALAAILAAALGGVGIAASTPVVATILMIVLPLVIGLVQRSKVVPASAVEFVEDELGLDTPKEESDESQTPADPAPVEETPEPVNDVQPAPAVVETPAAPADTVSTPAEAPVVVADVPPVVEVKDGE